jgi:hypothetical protein
MAVWYNLLSFRMTITTMVHMCCRHLVYSPRFGMFYQQQLGNPGADSEYLALLRYIVEIPIIP